MNIKLRALKQDDIWILHKWINEPELIRYTNSYRPISEMEQKEWFNNINYFKQNSIFGIESIEEKKLIGTCGLYDMDAISHKAELRMKIFELENRGKGIGKKALCTLLDFGFQDLNLHKIWLRVLEENAPAVKLYSTVGFKKEGSLREDIFIKGKYHDLLIMSLLANEFWDLKNKF